jgi:integrase
MNLAKIRVMIAEGKYLEKEEKPKITFEQAVKEFLEWGKSHLRADTLQRDEDFAALWKAFPRFRGRTLDEIATKDVEEYQQARITGDTGVGQKTADNDLMRLRRLFALAEGWGYVKGNPAKGVKLFRPTSERTRFLTVAEEVAITKKAAAWLRPLIAFSSATGLRRGELLALTWRDIDLAMRTLTVRSETSKSKRTRTIPLNAEDLQAIKTQPKALKRDLPIFPVAVKKGHMALMDAFSRALKATEVDPHEVSWHTLRHTFASRLVQVRVNLLTIQKLLGHATLNMVLKYAHLADDDLRQAVDTLSRKLQTTCNVPNDASGSNERGGQQVLISLGGERGIRTYAP